MGKRKERRLAALSNAGRRVKLDLFAEPSGDLCGSDVHNKVGGGEKDADELPNSPSSSGQRTQNPLLLLGQYSDDELEEESDERVHHPTVESSSYNNTKVDGLADQGCEDVNIKAGEGAASPKAEQPDDDTKTCLSDVRHQQVVADVPETDAGSSELQKQTDSSTSPAVVVPSEVQGMGDIDSGWRMVLHEESNQYYYWNTETGETSWTVPGVLTGTAVATCDQKANATGYTDSGPVGTYESNSVSYVEPGNSLAAQSLTAQSTGDNNESQMAELVEECKNEVLKNKGWGTEGYQIECQKNFYEVNALPGQERFADPGSSSDDALVNSQNRADVDLPVRLVGLSERLLEKLRSLKGSQGSMQGHDWISKYILEVEVRHSDIKELMSHGLPLFPFWSHSEVQLKRLEDAVDNEIYQLAKSAVMDEVAAINMRSLEEKDKSQENAGNEPEADGSKSKLILSDNPCLTGEAVDSKGGSLAGDLGNVTSAGEVNVTASNEMIPNPGSHTVEDVDMDVDMEVEDSSPDMATTNVSDFKSFGEAEQLSVSGFKSFGPAEQLNLHADTSSVAASDASAVPPPLGEEWIPPPPPEKEEVPPPPPVTDNEQIPPPPPDDYGVPPPPPDELQQPCYPPTVSYTQQSVPYAVQYNLTCPDSNYQYHGNIVAAVPDGQFYGHVGGSQVPLPHASFYYGTVPSTCSDAAPTTVTSIDAYYNLNEGTVPPLSVHSNPIDVSAAAGPGKKVDVSSGSAVSQITSSVIPSTSAAQVSSAAQSTGVVSAAVAASSSAKSQFKVARTKKRTIAGAPTLRSNKKVSRLVDKWKAAKEEMNESEEDEPESAYEILERKRQREIEEWRARQIASGEAKDNANFQPLGGDWREKVKRRRAQAARKAAETASEAPEDENQQPDIAQLSKDLPSGWRAYWDESTNQVYYGNSITSETSWTRPAN